MKKYWALIGLAGVAAFMSVPAHAAQSISPTGVYQNAAPGSLSTANTAAPDWSEVLTRGGPTGCPYTVDSSGVWHDLRGRLVTWNTVSRANCLPIDSPANGVRGSNTRSSPGY